MQNMSLGVVLASAAIAIFFAYGIAFFIHKPVVRFAEYLMHLSPTGQRVTLAISIFALLLTAFLCRL
jgi:hypothetical protein